MSNDFSALGATPQAPKEPIVTEPVVSEPVAPQGDMRPEEVSTVETPAETHTEPATIPQTHQVSEQLTDDIPFDNSPNPRPTQSSEDVDRLAREVIAGKWGTGDDRKARLTTSRYDYNAIQAHINELLNAGQGSYPTYTVQPGDTLSSIAARLSYTGGVPALYSKNQGVVGSNQNVIRTGQVLSL